jgi:acyl-CoA dehydrogenase
MIDFSIPDATNRQRARINEFIADVVIPFESEAYSNGVDDAIRIRLQTAARSAGVWAPQAPTSLGGGGFDFASTAILLEEAGSSLLGVDRHVIPWRCRHVIPSSGVRLI